VKYGFIAEHEGKFRILLMCRVLEVSRSGYYRWRSRPESRRAREDRRLLVAIRAVYQQSRCNYGSPRVHRHLKQQGESCGRKRVERLMRGAGLKARRCRRFKVTTRSVSTHEVAPNWLNRQFRAERPDQVWVGDITYIWTAEGWLYLSVLLDLCTRRVVGWAVSERLTAELARRALSMALGQRQPEMGLLHHSDRGCQYTSSCYQEELARRGLQASMSRRGNCYDNAVAESFFSTLKAELESYGQYQTRQQAVSELFDYIERFYNRQRLHSSLGYLSPAEFERQQQERQHVA
jgi:transposase InsO family protein